jgi:uncharacterized protein YbaR (Trm112 family)
VSEGIDPRLLDVLACPCPHHAPVRPVPQGLQCERCATVFPIRDGIPVMLLDEAVPGPNGIGSESGSGSES